MTRTALSLPLLAMGLGLSAHDHGHGNVQTQFHENRGQWPDQVLYRALTPGGAVFVERDAFTYLLTSGGARATHGRQGAVAEPFRAHAVKVRFEGARARGHEGTHRLPYYVNYFLGSDPSSWATGVPVFAGVELRDIYPGIGMRIDGHEGLKYDWLVAPGADPSRIVMRYEGQDRLRVENGLLYVETTAGTVVEQRPVAWQEVDGTRRPVECGYSLNGDRVGFELEGHDPRYPLVIDPVVIFSSYSGSTGNNFGLTATYDESGHLYGGGTVFDAGYPVTPGVVQTTFAGPVPGLFTMGTDMAVSKFAPDGTSLVWSTYIGGSGNEAPHSMVVNSANEIFIMGTTGSTDFPTTPGCYDNSFGGGNAPPFGAGTYGFEYTTGSDIVVVRLNATATALIGSTYVGGTGNDGLNQTAPVLRHYGDPFRGEIILDQQERPLVATSTMSAGLFTSPGAPQPNIGGGQDGYFFRMDPGLTAMLWATYYGGSGTDAGFGIQTSGTGDIYATGGTTSNNMPMAGTPLNPAFGGNTDGYIARFNPAGNQLLSATYLGTNAVDLSYFVQLDIHGNVFVIGSTAGAYPVTPGRYANANATQFIHKLTSDLSTSIWSTRVGGNGTDHLSPTAFLVSNCEQIYFSAWGGSTNLVLGSTTLNLPITPGAFQATTDGSDFYLMVLNKDAVSLEYATYFGGTSAEHVDGGTSRFDKNGIVYQAVCAGCSGSFPTTAGVVSTVNRSSCNLGVFKIDFEQNLTVNINASATGGTACSGIPFTFTATGNATTWIWDFGDGSPRTQGTPVQHPYPTPGTYRVMLIGIDSTYCGLTDTAYVDIIIDPCVHMVNTTGGAACPGECVEVRAAISNDHYPPYTYAWSHGATGAGPHQVCPAASTTYTVTVTDANGATATATVTAVVHPQPSVTATHTDATCYGSNDGTVTATPSGGTAPFTHAWNTVPVQTTPAASGLPPGTYTVTSTDANGCTATATATVGEPPELVPVTSTTPANCGASDGSATVAATGGTPQHTYAWNTTPVQTTTTATGLPAGTYTVTVTDANGCTATATATVTTVIAGQLTTSHTDVSCHGGSDGTTTCDVNGGNPPFMYSWNSTPPQTTATATGLPAGTYTVTVTDSQGCIATTQATVGEPTPVTLATGATPDPCLASVGTTTATASGGTPPYMYAWSTVPPQTTATATGLPAGTYTVTVTDDKGCTTTATATVVSPPSLSATVAATPVSCFGGSDGTTTANPVGGTPPYGYVWNSTPPQSGQTATGLAAGTWTVTVTDANGCTISANSLVNEPPELVLTSTPDPTSCGAQDGRATVDPVGGTPPYTYAWNTVPAQTTQTATGLSAGTYSVVVTDANGCTRTTSVTVTTPTPGTLSASHTNVSCDGGSDGTTTVTVAGGNPPYTYAWNTTPPQTTATATNLPAGTWTVTVTDAEGCVLSTQATVGQPTAIVPVTSTAPANCGMANGSATAGATGGNPPYTYSWNTVPPRTGQMASGIRAGGYTVVVTDANGCTATTTATVADIPGPVADFNTRDVCLGDATTLTNTSNGQSTITSSWDLGDSTTSTGNHPIHTYAGPGTYTVTLTVTDAAGCTATRTRSITVHPVPVAEFSGPAEGCSPVTATFTNNAPAPGTTCRWDFGDGSTASGCDGPVHTYTNPGCHTVTLTVTSPGGCSARRTLTDLVCVWGKPVAEFSIDPVRVPDTRPLVDFRNQTAGGSRYYWEFINGDSSSTQRDPSLHLRGFPTGRYNACLWAWNEKGCLDSVCKLFTIATNLFVYVPNAFTPEGDGHNETFIPILSSYDLDEYEFMVFNRWGELIFETGNPRLGWNGQYRGVMSKTDVYVWKLKVKSIDAGEAEEYVGHVTLLR